MGKKINWSVRLYTDWYKWNKSTESWDFNHRQAGFGPSETEPVPNNPFQEKAWKGAKWRKERVDTEGPTGTI